MKILSIFIFLMMSLTGVQAAQKTVVDNCTLEIWETGYYYSTCNPTEIPKRGVYKSSVSANTALMYHALNNGYEIIGQSSGLGGHKGKQRVVTINLAKFEYQD